MIFSNHLDDTSEDYIYFSRIIKKKSICENLMRIKKPIN